MILTNKNTASKKSVLLTSGMPIRNGRNAQRIIPLTTNHQAKKKRHYHRSRSQTSLDGSSTISTTKTKTKTTTNKPVNDRLCIGPASDIVPQTMPKITIVPPKPTDPVEQFGWDDFPLLKRCLVPVKPALVLPPAESQTEMAP